MAILGHAASAEDGSGFGIPGDQTGREVRMETLGTDGNKWVYIYRYPDAGKAYNVAEAARQACMNSCVGYSRETYTGWGYYHSRYGLWEAISEFKDIRKIDVPVNCDCSSMVSSCIRIAGIPGAVREMVTAVEDKTLRNLGFSRIEYSLEAVKKGDILWREGHTGIVVEGYDGTPEEPLIKYRGKITGLTPVYKTAKAALSNILTAHPFLGKGNLVDVCDETEGYYYVRIIDKYGYVPTDKLVRDDEKPKEPVVGDKVRFVGKGLYTSSGGGVFISVPNFDGTLNQKLVGRPYPCYVKSKAYDGWCQIKDLELK